MGFCFRGIWAIHSLYNSISLSDYVKVINGVFCNRPISGGNGWPRRRRGQDPFSWMRGNKKETVSNAVIKKPLLFDLVNDQAFFGLAAGSHFDNSQLRDDFLLVAQDAV